MVNSETGKPKSRKPLPRARAVAQLRALYASVPDARTKAAGHTGVMLAFFVPASARPRVTALQDGLPNPELPEDLHLTLAYLGDSTVLLPQAALLDELLSTMYFDLPLTGTIGGIGRFHHDEGNGTNAVYASFDSPQLPVFRQRLVELLKDRGIMSAENHGFTPHITLAYVPVGTDIPTLPPSGDMPTLTFDTLTLAWGDNRVEYGPGVAGARLRGMVETKAANFSARAGETIAGNLGRSSSGQFTRSGSAGTAIRPAATPPSKRARSDKQPPAATTPQKPGKGQRPRGAGRTRAGQTNRRRVAAELKKAGTGVGPKSMAALDALRTGKLKPDHLKTLEILAKTGMVQQQKDGSFRLAPSGTAFLEAADRGDTKAARAAIAANRPQTKPGKGSRTALTVTKDAAGRWRWLTFSSTAFRDRDGEIVSTKALADDVARADADGDYGTLRWWHLPGMDIGDCDFNAMSGRVLVESGTFRDERYGPLVAAHAHELGVSIGFKHAATEPDADKVFHSIRRFERSLMPLAYPSNLFTGLVVKETPTVEAAKIAGLKALGFDDAMIGTIQEQVTAREKAGDVSGITFKEAEAPAEAPVETAPAESPDGGESDQVFFGDLTLDQAQAWMQQQLAGIVTATATKAAREEETQVALKSTQDALAALQTTLKTDREAVDTKLTQALASIKELQGDVPAGIRRASQDPATIATKEQVETFKGPAADPMNDFLGFVTGSAG